MTDAEKQIIRWLAEGKKEYREDAIAIHRKELRRLVYEATKPVPAKPPVSLLKRLFGFLRKKDSSEEKEYNIIRDGDIRSISPEMAFMAEVDHPCPDYGLRSAYRTKLLEG